MCVLGVEGSEKKMRPPLEDNFWNSPKKQDELSDNGQTKKQDKVSGSKQTRHIKYQTSISIRSKTQSER